MKIIAEGTVVDHAVANGYPNVPHFYGEDALAGWINGPGRPDAPDAPEGSAKEGE